MARFSACRRQGKELVPLEPSVIDVPEAEEEEVSEEVAVDSESTESFPAVRGRQTLGIEKQSGQERTA
ncbi:unnamed protein product [Effrenium voratum]|nr:unnamed protein product [Effrenium voratum]